ncbi:hypothetical protein [Kribbella sp. NPDC004536]|uniref:hypothetical protein n=1 Tax=Kribbella sp. NPDC004536 TaxID=3364106 RepID=UPI00368B47DE
MVEGEVEWREPTWLGDGFDAVDYGLEIATDSGAVFSLTWDPRGEQEGIGLQRIPMLGSGVRSDADVAIWDVGARGASWVSLIDGRVTGVELHYVPWDEATGSFWCRRITLHGSDTPVEVVMGDSQDGVLVPSAETVAVLHPGTAVPVWR